MCGMASTLAMVVTFWFSDIKVLNTLIRKTGMQSKKIGWLVVWFFLASGAAEAQSQVACSISSPEGWEQSAMRWDGPCPGGVADGLGVLKEYSGKNVTRTFYGLVKNGEVKFGVIEEEGGYRAGNFEHGRVVESDDLQIPQITRSAFDKAADAAKEAAKRFEKAGNKSSAQFYRAKAEHLREVMD
jgi:hypothetical protein